MLFERFCLRVLRTHAVERLFDVLEPLAQPRPDFLEQPPVLLGQPLHRRRVAQQHLAAVRDHLVHGLVIAQVVLQRLLVLHQRVEVHALLLCEQPHHIIAVFCVSRRVVVLNKVRQLVRRRPHHGHLAQIPHAVSPRVDVEIERAVLVGAVLPLVLAARVRPALIEHDVNARRLRDLPQHLEVRPLPLRQRRFAHPVIPLAADNGPCELHSALLCLVGIVPPCRALRARLGLFLVVGGLSRFIRDVPLLRRQILHRVRLHRVGARDVALAVGVGVLPLPCIRLHVLPVADRREHLRPRLAHVRRQLHEPLLPRRSGRLRRRDRLHLAVRTPDNHVELAALLVVGRARHRPAVRRLGIHAQFFQPPDVGVLRQHLRQVPRPFGREPPPALRALLAPARFRQVLRAPAPLGALHGLPHLLRARHGALLLHRGGGALRAVGLHPLRQLAEHALAVPAALQDVLRRPASARAHRRVRRQLRRRLRDGLHVLRLAQLRQPLRRRFRDGRLRLRVLRLYVSAHQLRDGPAADPPVGAYTVLYVLRQPVALVCLKPLLRRAARNVAVLLRNRRVALSGLDGRLSARHQSARDGAAAEVECQLSREIQIRAPPGLLLAHPLLHVAPEILLEFAQSPVNQVVRHGVRQRREELLRALRRRLQSHVLDRRAHSLPQCPDRRLQLEQFLKRHFFKQRFRHARRKAREHCLLV